MAALRRPDRRVSAVHLDTHVVLWLYEPFLERLKPSMPHLEGRRLLISPMVLLELQYLYEIQRTTVPAVGVFSALAESSGLRLASSDWDGVVRIALGLSWTRDPFDRLIAAHAMADGLPLVTADERIRSHCPVARWGP